MPRSLLSVQASLHWRCLPLGVQVVALYGACVVGQQLVVAMELIEVSAAGRWACSPDLLRCTPRNSWGCQGRQLLWGSRRSAACAAAAALPAVHTLRSCAHTTTGRRPAGSAVGRPRCGAELAAARPPGGSGHCRGAGALARQQRDAPRLEIEKRAAHPRLAGQGGRRGHCRPALGHIPVGCAPRVLWLRCTHVAPLVTRACCCCCY